MESDVRSFACGGPVRVRADLIGRRPPRGVPTHGMLPVPEVAR